MQYPIFFPRHLAPSLLLAILTFVLAAPIACAQRRDFTGSYAISHVRAEGDQVTLTLSLTVHNYSGAEILNGGVILAARDLEPIHNAEPTPIAAFPLIKDFPFHTDITIRQTITIPAAEYARWTNGENPNLEFLKPDGHQGTIYETIDLRREIAPSKVAQ